jgi:hypothetical protein
LLYFDFVLYAIRFTNSVGYSSRPSGKNKVHVCE